MSVTIVWKDSNMSKAMEIFTIEAIKKVKSFEDSIKSATAIKRQLQNEYQGYGNTGCGVFKAMVAYKIRKVFG